MKPLRVVGQLFALVWVILVIFDVFAMTLSEVAASLYVSLVVVAFALPAAARRD